jgi:hypothetical protein
MHLDQAGLAKSTHDLKVVGSNLVLSNLLDGNGYCQSHARIDSCTQSNSGSIMEKKNKKIYRQPNGANRQKKHLKK